MEFNIKCAIKLKRTCYNWCCCRQYFCVERHEKYLTKYFGYTFRFFVSKNIMSTWLRAIATVLKCRILCKFYLMSEVVKFESFLQYPIIKEVSITAKKAFLFKELNCFIWIFISNFQKKKSITTNYFKNINTNLTKYLASDFNLFPAYARNLCMPWNENYWNFSDFCMPILVYVPENPRKTVIQACI